jgi:hypothetical protein
MSKLDDNIKNSIVAYLETYAVHEEVLETFNTVDIYDNDIQNDLSRWIATRLNLKISVGD